MYFSNFKKNLHLHSKNWSSLPKETPQECLRCLISFMTLNKFAFTITASRATPNTLKCKFCSSRGGIYLQKRLSLSKIVLKTTLSDPTTNSMFITAMLN